MPKSLDKPFSTRLPEEIRVALRALAQSLGLNESQCGRMLIIQKLTEQKSQVGVTIEEMRKHTAVVIATLSDELDFDDALEIVDQHVAPQPPVAQ